MKEGVQLDMSLLLPLPRSRLNPCKHGSQVRVRGEESDGRRENVHGGEGVDSC